MDYGMLKGLERVCNVSSVLVGVLQLECHKQIG